MSSEHWPSHRSLHYSAEELHTAWELPLPHHVAIIMDGNRRWVKKKFLGKVSDPFCGHWAGADTLIKIVEAASDLGIKILTVYGFSTENWGRSPEEVSTLLQIFPTYLENNRQKMVEHGVRLSVIGDITAFPASLQKTIQATSLATSKGRVMDLVIALNYGGRDEICRVFKKLGAEIHQGSRNADSINEETISSYLDTAPFGDPDLLIRTSGEKRVSNFLLWQLAYAEVYITDTLWPEFTARDLLQAVLSFQKRQRRRGK